jgi:hypothetical protein
MSLVGDLGLGWGDGTSIDCSRDACSKVQDTWGCGISPRADQSALTALMRGVVKWLILHQFVRVYSLIHYEEELSEPIQTCHEVSSFHMPSQRRSGSTGDFFAERSMFLSKKRRWLSPAVRFFLFIKHLLLLVHIEFIRKRSYVDPNSMNDTLFYK